MCFPGNSSLRGFSSFQFILNEANKHHRNYFCTQSVFQYYLLRIRKVIVMQFFSSANRECSQVLMVDKISQPGCAECGASGLVLTDYRPYAFLRALFDEGDSQRRSQLPFQKTNAFGVAANQLRAIWTDEGRTEAQAVRWW